jgi:hypothetical protein
VGLSWQAKWARSRAGPGCVWRCGLPYFTQWWLGNPAFLPETVMRLIEIQMRFQPHSLMMKLLPARRRMHAHPRIDEHSSCSCSSQKVAGSTLTVAHCTICFYFATPSNSVPDIPQELTGTTVLYPSPPLLVNWPIHTLKFPVSDWAASLWRLSFPSPCSLFPEPALSQTRIRWCTSEYREYRYRRY